MTCYDDAKRAYVECTKAANYHARVLQALDYYEQGLKFADSLHAVRSKDYQAFVAFDNKFAKRAKKLDGVVVELV